MIRKVAGGDYPVLIQGETGTGKELAARCIHERGPRRAAPFVPVDCCALAPSLAESELFGHVRGAFTGAICSSRGLLRAAGLGIVFLDEVGDLPLEIQAKLLRVLQEREIRPLGSTRTERFEARVIAATHRDLESAARTGKFRHDLFFRLNVVTLEIPPLRFRKDDIPILVEHFTRQFSKDAVRVSEKGMRRLLSYSWPGNVRELEHCIYGAIALRTGDVLDFEDLRPIPDQPPWNVGEELEITLKQLEVLAIRRALHRARGNKSLAARSLGIGKATLYRKLKQTREAGAY